MELVDAVVVGAGVVGLAVARALALRGQEVVVLEEAGSIGTETSSRNSEVIHAGLYYPANSLKARLCVEGREMLYAYAAAHGVPFRQLGKLIVANGAQQEAALHRIAEGAARCGVHDLVRLSVAEASALEPALSCTAALLSPSTGIIDSHALMESLRFEAEAHGALLCFNTQVAGGWVETGGKGGARFVLDTKDKASGERFALGARCLVNAAGLNAQALAARLGGFPQAHVPPLFLARGTYFAAAGKPAFSRLIYPVPEEGGLGVHLTLDMGRSMRFGPDVEWIAAKDYRVSDARKAGFERAIRGYWPGLPDNALHATYSGIRPKLSGPGQPPADFLVQDEASHGVPGLVNLFGIESPGLTASLALSELVSKSLESSTTAKLHSPPD